MLGPRETKHFKNHELACKCCGVNLMVPSFLYKAEQLRIWWGRPLIVTSGYRCPIHNAKVSTTGPNGPHTTGHALNFAMAGNDVFEFVKYATKVGMTGIGLKQHGDHSTRFVHLDDLRPEDTNGKRPRIFTYP